MAFGRWAEGQIKKWIDYSKGALLFVMVPDDPESGMFCVYDRKHQAFWMVDPVATSNFGAIAQISGYWTVKSFTRIKDSIALIRNRASRLRKALWLPAASLSLSKEVVGIHVLLRCMSRE